MNKKDLGNKIKYLREVVYPKKNPTCSKMTQAELGQIAFNEKNQIAAQQKIKRIEHGEQKIISETELEQICNALKISVSEFNDFNLFEPPQKSTVSLPIIVEEFFPRIGYYLQALEYGIEDSDAEHILEQIESFSRYAKKTISEKLNKKNAVR